MYPERVARAEILDDAHGLRGAYGGDLRPARLIGADRYRCDIGPVVPFADFADFAEDRGVATGRVAGEPDVRGPRFESVAGP